MATWTPQTKNTSTMTNQGFSNTAVWDDTEVDWDDAFIGWDANRGDAYSNQSKNTTVLTNQTKN